MKASFPFFVLLGAVIVAIWLQTAPESATVKYEGQWRPIAQHWTAGSEVLFKVKRISRLTAGRKVSIRVTSSWQSDKGTTYACGDVVHVIEKSGTEILPLVRDLPEKMHPGRYRLVGYTETVTNRQPYVSTFESEFITVEAPEKTLNDTPSGSK